MRPPPKDPEQPSAVAISGTIGIVGGDIVGGNKIIHGLTADELAIVISKIIDPINGLKQRFRDFQSIKRRIFLEQIKPTFTDLQRVIQTYEDYIVEFRIGLTKATDYRLARLSLFEYVEKRRITVRERTKLIAALEATLEFWQRKAGEEAASDAEIIRLIDFMEALRSYFVGTNLEFREYPGAWSDYSNDERFENLLTRSTSEVVVPATIGTTIIEIATHLLNAGYWESPDEYTDEFSGTIQSLVNTINLAIKSLGVRNKTLHKNFSALKLECTG